MQPTRPFRGVPSDVALKIKTEISGPCAAPPLLSGLGLAGQGWGLSSPPRRSHGNMEMLGPGLREGMTDAGTGCGCAVRGMRPIHWRGWLFRGRLSLGFQGGALDTASWTFGRIAGIFPLLSRKVHPTELGSRGPSSRYRIHISGISGLRVFRIRTQVNPGPGCNLQDREFGSVPLVPFSCMYMYIAVSRRFSRASARSELGNARGPRTRNFKHPLIRFDHPSSPLTGPPSPHLQNDPKQPHRPEQSPLRILSRRTEKAKDIDNTVRRIEKPT